MRPELYMQQQAVNDMLNTMPQQGGPVLGLPGIYTDYYPPEFWKYNSQYAGKLEWIGWRWWDTKTYTSGTTTALTNFFGTIPATIDLGNMQVAAQLAAPNAFMVRAVGWYLKQRPRAVTAVATANPQTGAVDNIAQLSNTGVAQLSIGSKVYGQWAMWQLTSGGGPYAMMTDAGAAASNLSIDWGMNGVPDPRAIYTLSKPIFIAPQINFKVDMTWPAALTLAGGNTDLAFFLDGDIIRPVQ
jgi:hypothetical protein